LIIFSSFSFFLRLHFFFALFKANLFEFLKKVIFKSLFSTLSSVILIWLAMREMKPADNIYSFGLNCLLVVFVLLISILLFGFDKSERKTISSILLKKLK